MQHVLEQWKTGASEPPPIARSLGIRLLAYGDGSGEVAMVCRGDMLNAMGTLHGGVVCDLADVAMGVAVASIVETPSSFSTIELHARFLKPVRDGTLVASARV